MYNFRDRRGARGPATLASAPSLPALSSSPAVPKEMHRERHESRAFWDSQCRLTLEARTPLPPRAVGDSLPRPTRLKQAQSRPGQQILEGIHSFFLPRLASTESP